MNYEQLDYGQRGNDSNPEYATAICIGVICDKSIGGRLPADSGRSIFTGLPTLSNCIPSKGPFATVGGMRVSNRCQAAKHRVADFYGLAS